MVLSRLPELGFRSDVLKDVGFRRCHSDHSVFIRRCSFGMTVVAVYIYDILLIGDGITKAYLQKHFVNNNLRRSKYFLRIEIASYREKVASS